MTRSALTHCWSLHAWCGKASVNAHSSLARTHARTTKIASAVPCSAGEDHGLTVHTCMTMNTDYCRWYSYLYISQLVSKFGELNVAKHLYRNRFNFEIMPTHSRLVSEVTRCLKQFPSITILEFLFEVKLITSLLHCNYFPIFITRYKIVTN